MKTLEWTTVDKSDWSPGPWNNEPDKRQWLDPATQLACLINRSPSGALCGYVGVPPSHPFHGLDYWPEPDDHPLHEIDVHGGLTYAAGCATTEDESTGICHVTEAGDPDPVWWFGFDCAHYQDFVPGYAARAPELYARDGVSYKDFEWVTAEVERLAAQLKEAQA